jgi:hypothetical protein
MQRNIDHNHNIEFPQLDQATQHIQANQKFYIGLGIGLAVGYWFKPRPTKIYVVGAESITK